MATRIDDVEGWLPMRTNPQNDCLHKWSREIANHINAEKKVVTEETIKELILLKLGNTKEIMGEKVAMRSHKYRATDEELTAPERKAGHIAMNELLMAVEVWANMDLGLRLVRDEEIAA